MHFNHVMIRHGTYYRPRTVVFAALLAIAGSVSLTFESVQADDAYRLIREDMIRLIEDDVRATSFYLKKTALDPRVLDSMRKVRRHEFVPPKLVDSAYQNRPLPIGHGQTISQPYIVAVMTDLLGINPDHRVLEIGTGSGYQSAVLAELANSVFSIEIIQPLGQQAEQRLRRLGYDNIELRIGDGYYGWTEHAPFDAIIVTAASGHVPPPLVKQLRVGGKMIIPVGSRFATQELILITRESDGGITTRQILPVRFVPLTGEH